MSFAATSSIFPRPTASSDPNFGHLRIKDDILYPKDEAPYTGRDLQIRIALFVISQATPIVASILIMLSRKSWWSRNFNWTMSRLVVLWLLSIQIFGAIVYAQKGATTRVLFLAATLHLQIEYMIIALLLKASPLLALGIAYLAGAILLTVQLFLPDLSLVYIISTTFGFTDFLIPLLLAYGKQWLYAAGGFAHLIQAIGVFCIVVKNFGHIEFAAITFVTTWIMNGALVAAIYQTLREAKSGGVAGRIRLNGDEDNNGDLSKASQGEAIDNPLAHIDIPRKTVIIMFAVSIVGSIISAFTFTFVVARN